MYIILYNYILLFVRYSLTFEDTNRQNGELRFSCEIRV